MNKNHLKKALITAILCSSPSLAEEISFEDQNKLCSFNRPHLSKALPTPVDIAKPQVPQGVEVRKLQSLPSAPAVIFLNFDGGTYSVQNENFTYTASGKSDDDIYAIWALVKEDYIPFNVNVTTDKALFEATALDRRTQVIISPTLKRQGFAGWSFRQIDDDGLAESMSAGNWRTIGEIVTHEAGHSVGNAHSKFYDSQGALKDYYGGQGFWGPIMGDSPHPLTQWDRGEFQSAYYSADNLGNFGLSWKDDQYNIDKYVDRLLFIGQMMDVNNTGFPQYRSDPHGNDIASATSINIESDGSILNTQNTGAIILRDDLDFFKLKLTESSRVQLNIKPDSVAPNLNILAKLHDAQGNTIKTSNPISQGLVSDVDFKINLDASFDTTLAAGDYFVSIEGTGEGNPKTTGFSDYGSLGQYNLSGQVTADELGNTSSSNLSSQQLISSALVLSSNELASSSNLSSQQIISSSIVLSSSEQASSTSQDICVGVDNWQAKSYDWSNSKEYVVYDSKLYSHSNWVDATAPDQNSSWTFEGNCTSQIISSSIESSSSVQISSSEVIVTTVPTKTQKVNLSAFEIELQISRTELTTVSLMDITGKLILEKQINPTLGQKIQLNKPLEQGVYFVRVKNSSSSEIHQAIVR